MPYHSPLLCRQPVRRKKGESSSTVKASAESGTDAGRGVTFRAQPKAAGELGPLCLVSCGGENSSCETLGWFGSMV